MAYVVSARKYRPQLFEEVVGQEHVTSTIKNALLNDKLAHAFLFCGPRGVGKTTCARLLAKAINMPDPKQALKDGSYASSEIDISLNIVELDAASNNSVENIRTLIEQVRFQPQKGKYKVFIIDEVHMLSQAAFNAFLKTLEEPPPYAIFILATTERHKILPTILSRCQLYDFRRIQIPDIIVQLEEISKKEGIKSEYDALYIIAEKADGAMRDALSIFDRIVSASGDHITLQDVINNLNILDFDYFFRAVDHILAEDASGLLLLLDQVLKNGFEGDTFMNGLSQHIRNLLYSKQEPTQKMLQMSSELKEKYLAQSNAISYSSIMTALSIANQCDLNYPKAKDKRLHVEISLMKICYAGRQVIPELGYTALPPSQKKTNAVNNPMTQVQGSEKQISKAPVTTTSDPVEIVATDSPVAPTAPSAPKTVVPAEDKPKPIKSPPSAGRSKSDGFLNTPSISSLDDILLKAQQEVDSGSIAPKNVTLEEVEDVWSEYIKTIESATTSGILNTVIKEVRDGKVLIMVPSNIAREEIQQEADLYALLRDRFNRNDLVVEISVDREKFPDLIEENQVKLFTPKEKYDHLKAINPLVDDLIEQLDLKLDQ